MVVGWILMVMGMEQVLAEFVARGVHACNTMHRDPEDSGSDIAWARHPHDDVDCVRGACSCSYSGYAPCGHRTRVGSATRLTASTEAYDDPHRPAVSR